jgi:hypothetical protein
MTLSISQKQKSGVAAALSALTHAQIRAPSQAADSL